MRTRIISSAVALLILAVVMLLGREALGIAIFIAALLGIREFYSALEKAGSKPIKAIGYICCLPLLYFAIFGIKGIHAVKPLELKFATLGVFIMLLAALAAIVFRFGKVSLSDISYTFFGVLYVVFLFSFVTLVRNLDNGHLYVWMVFIGAWATDTSAYFAGISLGRHRILPEVSPKKTLEGSIGGVLGCMLVMVGYGCFVNTMVAAVPLYHFAVIGLICGIVSQLGDWAASAIKRLVNIKDFGNIMPGHGGVLDRFDSILIVAPVVYFYTVLLL